MHKNSFRKNIILTTLVVSVASLIAGGMMGTSAHAENAKTIYDEAVLAAEIEFAETITQAKQELKLITSNPDVDSETKQLAEKEYDKIVADAKVLRDQKIDQAQSNFDQAIEDGKITLEKAKKHLIQTINDAKLEYNTQLKQAEDNYIKSIENITDNEELKELEDEYKKIIDELKQVYNNAITLANQDYHELREIIQGGENDA
ncbi:hypothetical protein [Nitrosopumilus sp.]|uniref:hypothetical protein n=1 Tax=Nitrosopumilus sp. TaxID=2024843 RepID=UPI00242B89B3|nr:hypothetical protein [Nitrosopumilus sp.]